MRDVWPRRPLSTVLYTVDKGLRGRNILHQVLSVLLTNLYFHSDFHLDECQNGNRDWVQG